MAKLAENLKALRVQNKLSMQVVADHLIITRATYSNFETGKGEPNLKLLVKMADLYNVSLDELSGRQFTPNGVVIDQVRMKTEMNREINAMVKQIANEFIQSKEADIVKRIQKKFSLA
ncbi:MULTISPECIES: helix-turn-helix domain-containing protein [Planococcus]|uniref:XRE family transcriptional regulator n=1 Tax=Planococcus maitriensis TaxID=221799 RepID=A0A365K3E7_9BACL|nr:MULTISPECIES: helix-turn-helix transcriptional regulator [Planococcus]AUD13216.1 XRE family transcriptional regulator [Planococcus sp. MB-3u-03]PKG46017.1 XRE family transcriptional regulator [Planococcus sp. Urea-trap-24]PKG89109.1 XRE family transcriptional regulator [Planococcus sp. Urea-3u-39]PKH39143.1 XRE family transcriptional regulator [Planococcus sp. MB-3u-09]RAZ67156.1 XRE family transcriptional regulator [Planococcus maitriensis]